LYGQRARASIQGQWTLIRVDNRLGRSSSVIIERIPRSSDLLAVPHRDLGEKLAPQAQQVFRGLDEEARGLARSSRLWISSSGPLAGRGASSRPDPLDRGLRDPGRLGHMGTHVSHMSYNSRSKLKKMFHDILFPRFGVTKVVISDGGPHFIDGNFRRCIDDSAWFLKVWMCCSRLFLVVIFSALSW
jgi:hypothetical protein